MLHGQDGRGPKTSGAGSRVNVPRTGIGCCTIAVLRQYIAQFFAPIDSVPDLAGAPRPGHLPAGQKLQTKRTAIRFKLGFLGEQSGLHFPSWRVGVCRPERDCRDIVFGPSALYGLGSTCSGSPPSLPSREAHPGHLSHWGPRAAQTCFGC